jgi:hypothetical protein
MPMILIVAAAALACHGPAPQADCQCICTPSDTQPAGLIYVCKQRRWFCPKPAASLPPKRKSQARPAPHR